MVTGRLLPAVEEVTPEQIEATLRIDLASMFHCARRAIPALRAFAQRLLGCELRAVREAAAERRSGGPIG